jgi:integrase
MKKTFKLTDGWARAAQEFETRGVFHDAELKGFRVRVGVHRMTFFFFQEHRVHGVRSTTCKRLGFWPSMTTDDARRAALEIAGSNASGRIEPGRRAAVKFESAMVEYLAHLRAQSARKGKLARWARAVESINRLHLKHWHRWTLAEMSNSPAAIRDWHMQVSRERGPVIANKAAKVMRAAYKLAAKLNRGLPPGLPTSAVTMNVEQPRQVSIEDWAAWRAAWEAIGNPVRRAFHLVQLLTGARGSELSALKWTDVDCKHRVLILRATKSGHDVRVPMSAPIAMALKLARSGVNSATVQNMEWVFPGNGSAGHMARGTDDLLPVAGHALRHTWRTVAHEVGIDELSAHLCLGHAPAGVSARYLHTLALSLGPGLRRAQARVSRRIVSLLGLP